ncbi:MAG: DUF389 domain-containing protein, partial [Gammaproteobacteria bacterium]
AIAVALSPPLVSAGIGLTVGSAWRGILIGALLLFLTNLAAITAAASLVLTAPGLSTIIHAVEEARRIFGRMMSYTIYRIAMTIDIMVFVVLAMLATHTYPLTALMIILLALLDDLPIMTIAVRPTWRSSADVDLFATGRGWTPDAVRNAQQATRLARALPVLATPRRYPWYTSTGRHDGLGRLVDGRHSGIGYWLVMDLQPGLDVRAGPGQTEPVPRTARHK